MSGEKSMVFSSVFFVFCFLPVTLLFYFLAEKIGNIRIKNAVVLIASLFFYAWGGVGHLLLLLALLVVNYLAGLGIGKFGGKVFLILGIVVDVGSLVFFKYLNFLIDNLETLLSAVSGRQILLYDSHIALPIGISFFIFQIMSYLIDVYRKQVPVQKNIFRLALYIMMFPQLIAGPIVRYIEINKEIEQRITTPEMAEHGIRRFVIGFAKKVFVANVMGSMADAVFAITGPVNFLYAWLGAICYALQIYYDFSAYSDMAIGLGEIFGFHFNENFRYPYISASIQEFWRRWHISLSTWFRDYVYIPLGGNRKGKMRMYLNSLIVFALTGIWHGAEWQFLVWGMYHGLFLTIEKMGFKNVLKKIPPVLRHLYTLLVVCVGWVFFRATTLTAATEYLQNMFTFSFDGLRSDVVTRFTGFFWFMFVLAIIFSMPAKDWIIGKVAVLKNETVVYAGCLLLFIVSVVYLSGLSYNPFIYFKF